MLAGVIVIQDTDRLGKVDASQLPDPDGPVAQKDHDPGFGNTAPDGFGAQERAELFGGENIGQVGSRAVIALWTLVGFLGFAVRKDGPYLTLAGVGLAAAFAFASFKLLGSPGCASAVGADIENVSGGGIIDWPLGLSPLSHVRGRLHDHALDWAGIDVQTGVGQQVLAGGLITAGQSAGTAHPAGDFGRIAVHQPPGGVQWKTPRLPGGTVKIGSPQGDPAQASQ